MTVGFFFFFSVKHSFLDSFWVFATWLELNTDSPAVKLLMRSLSSQSQIYLLLSLLQQSGIIWQTKCIYCKDKKKFNWVSTKFSTECTSPPTRCTIWASQTAILVLKKQPLTWTLALNWVLWKSFPTSPNNTSQNLLKQHQWWPRQLSYWTGKTRKKDQNNKAPAQRVKRPCKPAKNYINPKGQRDLFS